MALMTKPEQVERYVRKQITTGKFSPGDKLLTDREMTNKFGVSLMTIREALIRLAKDGLIERKQGSGTYVADCVKKATIGIVANANHITSSSYYQYESIINESSRRVEAAGLRSTLFIVRNRTEVPVPSDLHLFDKGVVEQIAGVISLINLTNMEERLEEEGLCAVSIGEPYSKYFVVNDFEAMTRQGVQMLHDQGHHEFTIMHFDYSQLHYDAEHHSRITRMIENTREFAKVNLVSIPVTASCEHAYEAFKRLWASPQRPRAIFFYDDGICDVATRAILELGIKVPEELAILTMHNVGRKFTFPIPLTGIGFDPSQAAGKAWTILSELIDGKEIKQAKVLVPPRVQKGLSLGENIDV